MPLSAPAARRLHLHTEGNPLYAGALIHKLDKGQLQRRPAVSLPALRSFANLVTARLVRCSPDTRELVTAMAVLGFHCRIRDAAEISGVADPLRCVDEAIDAQLLSIPAPGDEEARFVHWLARAAVYFDLSPGRRSRLHSWQRVWPARKTPYWRTGWRPVRATTRSWPRKRPTLVAGRRRPELGRRPLRPSPQPDVWLPNPRTSSVGASKQWSA